MKIPKHYIPNNLSNSNKKLQEKLIKKSRKMYKKGQYFTRKKIKSFKSRISPHILKAQKIYNISSLKPSKLLAKKTKCKLAGLKKIVNKGRGAYYSSGSRPSQTPDSWGIARLASAITGGNSSKIDYHILKKHCSKDSIALKMAIVPKSELSHVNGGGDNIVPKVIKFEDYPDFQPNLTPSQIFQLGSFGGTYWRPITSNISEKPVKLKNIHKNYPNFWWKNIPESHLSSNNYNKNINKYKVKVGTDLEFWESKNWITEHNRYGWMHWYCDFYNGKRTPGEDERQIGRWKGIASENGRFRKWLITLIKKKNGTWDDTTISPAIRQTLQHWGYQLTKEDFK